MTFAWLIISPIIIKNVEILRKNELRYLGYIIDEKVNKTAHVKMKSKSLMRQTYSLYHTGLMDRTMDLGTKLFIYTTYCRSNLLYGLDLIDLMQF